MLAAIADGGRATVHIDREASRNNFITRLIYNLLLNPLKATSPNPFCRGSWGWGMLVNQNHATGVENGSSWWGCL
jgi:hypothetical protein